MIAVIDFESEIFMPTELDLSVRLDWTYRVVPLTVNFNSPLFFSTLTSTPRDFSSSYIALAVIFSLFGIKSLPFKRVIVF